MLFHIGYPKASSTWLQERLFLTEHGYFPVYFEKSEREALNRLVVDPPFFSYDAARFHADLSQRIAAGQQLADLRKSKLVPVVSGESLAGLCNDADMGSVKFIADRIFEAAPDAKILVIVREQFSIILSGYYQYVRGGGVRSLEGFVHAPEVTPTDDSSWMGIYPAYYEYHHLVSYYQNMFGKDSVLALPFETLKNGPADYIEKISKFSGATTDVSAVDTSPVKEGIPANIIGPRRFANAFLSTDLDNPFTYTMPPQIYWRVTRYAKRGIDAVGRQFPTAGSRKRFRERLDRHLGDYYAASNKRLAELTGTDFAALGYRV